MAAWMATMRLYSQIVDAPVQGSPWPTLGEAILLFLLVVAVGGAMYFYLAHEPDDECEMPWEEREEDDIE